MEELINIAADRHLFFCNTVFKDEDAVNNMVMYLKGIPEVNEATLKKFHEVFVNNVVSGDWYYECPKNIEREGFKLVFNRNGVFKSAFGEKRVDYFIATIKN